MTMAVELAATSEADGRDGSSATGDVFGPSGIMRNLARVMTFHSLYRLEHRAPVHQHVKESLVRMPTRCGRDTDVDINRGW